MSEHEKIIFFDILIVLSKCLLVSTYVTKFCVLSKNSCEYHTIITFIYLFVNRNYFKSNPNIVTNENLFGFEF